MHSAAAAVLPTQEIVCLHLFCVCVGAGARDPSHEVYWRREQRDGAECISLSFSSTSIAQTQPDEIGDAKRELRAGERHLNRNESKFILLS